jgi:phosphatidylglycerol lysyltransferase
MLKTVQRFGHFLPYVLFLVAAYMMHRQVTIHPMHEVMESVSDTPWQTIAGACGLTLINYVVLSGFDWLGIVYAGQKVPYRRVLMTSLISYAISNNTGHALVSGTSVRYRFYSASGISGWDILKIAVFSAMTFLIAAFTLEAALSLFFPEMMKQGQSLPGLVHGITLVSAAVLGLYWGAVLFLRGTLTVKNYEFRMPSPGLALAQTAVGVTDLILGSSILYTFLDLNANMPFLGFLSIYVLSLLAGIGSQVPGGLGVFETTFIYLAGPEFSSADILGALVLYRIVYFFLPLVAAGFGMFIYELRHHGERLGKGRMLVSTALSQSMPAIFSLLLFFAGAMLLVSGATPGNVEHTTWLRQYVPLFVVEISHVTASLTAIALLFLARAVRIHMRAGWYGSILMLFVGVAAAILRGGDWIEAVTLGLILLMMLPIRRHFDRKGSLAQIPLTRGWAGMIALVLICSTWAGFFAYRHVGYDNALWLHFSYAGHAARFLRALGASASVIIGYVCYRLLTNVHPGHIALPTPDELDRAHFILRQGDTTEGFPALLGDKNLLWAEDGRAFLMYTVTPTYWIALGDPVGDSEGFEPLTWKFREMADSQGAQAVFYQVSDRHLPLYLDLGMVMLKIGEEARVRLDSFSLAGGKRENQRKNRNRFLKQGFTFRILPPQELEEALPRLRDISDRWLEKKNVKEKGFSVGFYNEDYLRRTSVAVIEKDHHILAFANFWDLDNRRALAIDLMRYDPDSPPNLMEFLFVEMILWGQLEKYETFSLGMAPLSGLEKHPLAPLWHKIGNVIFEHGEEFYNFEGLYAYKSKFDPEWTPRYLAAPSGLRLPLVLMSIASVISNSRKGALEKDDNHLNSLSSRSEAEGSAQAGQSEDPSASLRDDNIE